MQYAVSVAGPGSLAVLCCADSIGRCMPARRWRREGRLRVCLARSPRRGLSRRPACGRRGTPSRDAPCSPRRRTLHTVHISIYIEGGKARYSTYDALGAVGQLAAHGYVAVLLLLHAQQRDAVVPQPRQCAHLALFKRQSSRSAAHERGFFEETEVCSVGQLPQRHGVHELQQQYRR